MREQSADARRVGAAMRRAEVRLGMGRRGGLRRAPQAPGPRAQRRASGGAWQYSPERDGLGRGRAVAGAVARDAGDGRARDGRWRGRALVRARLFSRDDREASRAGRPRARRSGGGRRVDLASARILGALVVLRQPDSAQHPGRARDGERRARGGRPAASLASDFRRTAHLEDGRRHDRRSRASQERRRRYRVRHFPIHLRQHDDSRDFSGVGADRTRGFARFIRRMGEIARRIPAAQNLYRRLGSAHVGGQARVQLISKESSSGEIADELKLDPSTRT